MALEMTKDTMTWKQRKGTHHSRILLEGDMIVPDNRPDVAQVLHCSGTVRLDEVKSGEEKINLTGELLVRVLYRAAGGENDNRPDVAQVLHCSGTVRLDEVKSGEEKINLTGELLVRVLYRAAGGEKPVYAMTSSLPIQEVLYVEGMTAEDAVNVMAETEHLECQLINDRKVGLRAIVEVWAEAEGSKTACHCGSMGGSGRQQKPSDRQRRPGRNGGTAAEKGAHRTPRCREKGQVHSEAYSVTGSRPAQHRGNAPSSADPFRYRHPRHGRKSGSAGESAADSHLRHRGKRYACGSGSGNSFPWIH